MAFFKRRKDLGPLLLGLWLIATGLRALLWLSIPFAEPILALLALAAGILILLGR
ncbi:MAG TPA: hypothetical protein VF590_20870 [Isosphaeraceae bacterium]